MEMSGRFFCGVARRKCAAGQPLQRYMHSYLKSGTAYIIPSVQFVDLAGPAAHASCYWAQSQICPGARGDGDRGPGHAILPSCTCKVRHDWRERVGDNVLYTRSSEVGGSTTVPRTLLDRWSTTELCPAFRSVALGRSGEMVNATIAWRGDVGASCAPPKSALVLEITGPWGSSSAPMAFYTQL